MKKALWLVVAMLFVTPAFTQNVDAQLQMRSSVGVQRTCTDELVIQWIAYDPVKIEYSATDTSLNWTSGMKSVPDVNSQIHTDPIGRAFDKVIVNFIFADGSNELWDANVGTCSDLPVVPGPPIDAADATIIVCAFYGDQEVEKVLTVGDLLADDIVTADKAGNLTLTEYGASFIYLEPCSDKFTENATLQALDTPGDVVTICENGETRQSEVSSNPNLSPAVVNTLFRHPYRIGLGGYYLNWNAVSGDVTPGPCAAEVTPEPSPDTGTPGQTIHHYDGSFNDPVTGNSFAFLTAERTCEDASFRTTWSGTNIDSVDFAVLGTGGGTDWMPADTTMRSFSADVPLDTFNRAQAAVTFTDGSVEAIMINIGDCTSETQVVDAELGENALRVQFSLPDGADISGAPYSLYAPQVAAQAITTPFLSGFVGANNSIAIDGLIPGQYRLVVTPAGMDPIDILVTVGDQPVTNAVVTVDADGTASVAYLVQEETPAATTPAEQPADTTPAAAGQTQSGSSDSAASAGSGVTGLPSTGAGSTSGTVVLMTAAVLAVILIPSGIAVGIRRKG